MKTKRILALLMAMAMIFAFAACGDDAEEKKDSKDVAKPEVEEEIVIEEEPEVEEEIVIEEEPEVEEEIVIEEEPEVEDNTDAKAVADYIAKNESAIKSGFAGSGADEYAKISARAEGTTVVIECTFTIEVPEDAASQLQPTLDGMRSSFKAFIEAMKGEEPAVSGALIRYLDMNGKVIAQLRV